MRSIPPDFDAGCVAAIDRRLDEISRGQGVAIPLAIESGSRAWGFPSPDSDYDCRFLFVRRREDYLTPWPKRDVIETPLEGELDVNGWELGKALKLLLKGNAVVIEWLMSSIVYRGDPAFREELIALAAGFTSPHRVARHYLHLGERQRRTYFADGKAVKLKKIFYALRPAAALRWLRLHPGEAIAPMHFPRLMVECDAPADVAAITAELIARKAVTRELGSTHSPGRSKPSSMPNSPSPARCHPSGPFFPPTRSGPPKRCSGNGRGPDLQAGIARHHWLSPQFQG